jgi:hypothetical protein
MRQKQRLGTREKEIRGRETRGKETGENEAEGESRETRER